MTSTTYTAAVALILEQMRTMPMPKSVSLTAPLPPMAGTVAKNVTQSQQVTA